MGFENLKQILDDDKLWRGAGAKRQWQNIEDTLREEFKKMDE